MARYDSRTQQFVPHLPDIPAQSPGALSFSRDGRWVAYVSSGILYRSRTDGSERLRLTSIPLAIDHPRFSADGKRIAFHAYRQGDQFRIFVISAGGGEPEAMTSGSYMDLEPEWSPDGNLLLFRRGPPPSGGSEAKGYACLLDIKAKRLSPLPGSEGAQAFRWSPQGRYIFAVTGSGLRLFDFQFQSGEWRQLVKPSAFRDPFWSQDGRYICGQEFVGHVDQPIIRIRVRDGTIERVTTPDLALPPDVAGYSFAGLAPDGSPLAILLRKNSDIYALDLDLP